MTMHKSQRRRINKQKKELDNQKVWGFKKIKPVMKNSIRKN